MPEHTSNTARRTSRVSRKYSLQLRLLGCFGLVAVATLFGGAINHGLFLWVANGVILAYLLLAPRRLWPWYLAASLFAHLAVSPWMHTEWIFNLYFVPHDIIEATLAALLLRRRSTELPVFTNAFYLLRFATCAVIIAPLIISFFYSLIFALWQHEHFLGTFGQWFMADSLGILVTAPACVALFRFRIGRSGGIEKHFLQIIPFLAVITLLLCQNTFPGPSLLFPLLILVLLSFGMGWASFATLATAAIGAWCTAHGLGPFADRRGVLPPGVRLQIYIVSIMSVLYGVSVVIENLRKTERSLQRIANLHALVAENSRDVILLLDFEGGRNFISSPEHFWGGWSRDEILASSTLDLIHPEDRGNVVAVLKDLRTKQAGALIEARARHKDSSYCWLELSLRTVRDPISHLPTGVLANIREITERKQAEQQLEDAYHAVEELSVTDPLTGLPNRRRFDAAIAAEWRRALREQNPLSLLLIDADNFKKFNDIYGHPSGDVCLKHIADAVRAGATRSGDLAARIGGEEFAVLLPHASGGGARGVANHICDEMRAQALPHTGNSNGIVTVSVGCATVVPQPGQSFSLLIDMADQALYSAKHAGRNCVYPPTSIEESEELAPAHEHVGFA